MTRPDAADLLVGACVVALAAGDVQLYRHGRRLVTDALRRPVVAVGLVVLTLHVLDVLGRVDPFRACARRIPRSLEP